MIYQEYERRRREYKQAQEDYRGVLEEMERLFALTQPQAVDTSRDAVSSGSASGTDRIDHYLIQKERLQLDERLKSAEEIVAGKKKLLEIAREKIMMSEAVEDIVFRMRFIKHSRIHQIVKETHYSERQIFRILDKIKANL